MTREHDEPTTAAVVMDDADEVRPDLEDDWGQRDHDGRVREAHALGLGRLGGRCLGGRRRGGFLLRRSLDGLRLDDAALLGRLGLGCRLRANDERLGARFGGEAGSGCSAA